MATSLEPQVATGPMAEVQVIEEAIHTGLRRTEAIALRPRMVYSGHMLALHQEKLRP
jgi:hypothetical protein